MFMYRVLLMLALAFLTISTGTSVAATQSRRTKIESVTVFDASIVNQENSGRLLRVSGALEERGIMASIKMWLKTTYWAYVGKSDDYVMKSLGLKGMTEAELVASPKYQYLLKFWKKVERRTVNKWYNDETPTQTIWKDYGLEGLTEGQLQNNPKFKTYVRYATKYDDANYYHSNYLFEKKVYYGGTLKELNVKADIWAKAKRPDWYVKQMLQLHKTPENLPVYNRFVELRNKMKQKH